MYFCQKFQPMENQALHNVSFESFQKYFDDKNQLGFVGDFCFLNAKLTGESRTFSHPFRIDSYLFILCESGHLRLDINLTEVELRKNMIFVSSPGNIIKIKDVGECESEKLSYIVLAMSKEYVSSLGLDLNKTLTDRLSQLDCPIFSVSEEDTEMLSRNNELISSIIASDAHFKKEMVNALISAGIYHVMSIWSKSLQQKPQNHAPSSRSRVIYENFLKLVAEYHTQYRNVGFYADKLSLTPKYLSKLVKNESGRSAPEWIDAYVILEAKNLLKHSNIAIKEIVYKLNFPNQSVFYKFFKMRTGMTPSEYRNS